YQIRLAENLVNTLLGQNILPRVPLFVLTILQLSEGHIPHNTDLGAYGYHYDALITTRLTKAVASRRARATLDTIYTYVGHLADEMVEKKRRFLLEHELLSVTEQYKTEFGIQFGLESVLGVLSEAGIFYRDSEDRYVFAYRYIFCYFVARHLAPN